MTDLVLLAWFKRMKQEFVAQHPDASDDDLFRHFATLVATDRRFAALMVEEGLRRIGEPARPNPRESIDGGWMSPDQQAERVLSP